jgi:hypothetical protein
VNNPLCKEGSPEPPPRNSNTCRNPHFSCGEMGIPAGPEVLEEGFGEELLTRSASPILLLLIANSYRSIAMKNASSADTRAAGRPRAGLFKLGGKAEKSCFIAEPAYKMRTYR